MNYIDDAVLIAITVSLVEMAKRLGLPSKYAPLLSIAFCIGASFAYPVGYADTIFRGLIWGLTASGAYSGTRATFRNEETNI